MKPCRQPPARTGQLLPRLLLVLTAVTGLVDAASYLALGRVFIANITRSFVLLAFAAAGASGLSVSRSGKALAAFALGASIAGRIAARADASRHKWTGIAFGIEAGLLWALRPSSQPKQKIRSGLQMEILVRPNHAANAHAAENTEQPVTRLSNESPRR